MKQISTKRAAFAAIAYFLIIQVAAWLAYFTAGTNPPILIFVGATLALGAPGAAFVFYFCRAANATRFKLLLALLCFSFVCVSGSFVFGLFTGKFDWLMFAQTILCVVLIVVLWASKDNEFWKDVEPNQPSPHLNRS